jgi:hypothetical protein
MTSRSVAFTTTTNTAKHSRGDPELLCGDGEEHVYNDISPEAAAAAPVLLVGRELPLACCSPCCTFHRHQRSQVAKPEDLFTTHVD